LGITPLKVVPPKPHAGLDEAIKPNFIMPVFIQHQGLRQFFFGPSDALQHRQGSFI
jgi:hypothetical protein